MALTPRQAVMWFVALLIIVSAVYIVIAYLITKKIESTFPGWVLLFLGVGIGLIVKKIKWS